MSTEIVGRVMTLGLFRELTAYMSEDLRMDSLPNEIFLYEDNADINQPSFNFDDPNWTNYSILLWVEPELYQKHGISAFLK